VSRLWHRIERHDARGDVEDWVEVGRCIRCGRGVDREFPVEYREANDTIYCRSCWQERAREATARDVGTLATLGRQG
jgi:DNA-directed RNA polymerase subunit RPC12/RpoP